MVFDLKSYLIGKHGGAYTPSADLPSYLMGKKKSAAIKTLTGTPPFTFKSKGDNLVDWSIKGNAGGVGKRTKNLLKLTDGKTYTNSVEFDASSTTGFITVNGTNGKNENLFKAIHTFTATVDTPLYVSGCADGGTNETYYVYVFDATAGERAKKWNGTTNMTNSYNTYTPSEFLAPANHTMVVRILIRASVTLSNKIFKPMVRAADTNADFIPYGYEIPVTCGGKTTDIFIGDSPLGADDTITKTSTGVDIPTIDGSNTLTVGTTVQPSEMSITYHK